MPSETRPAGGRSGQLSPVDRALAALIANTRRRGRKHSLLELAEWIAIARDGLGSLEAVAEAIDVSSEMLREFLAVRELAPQVKELIARRQLDSVDVAHRLGQLSAADQLEVARSFVRGEMDSKDVRAVVALRRTLPRAGIGKVIDNVVSSKDITGYVFEFAAPSHGADLAAIREQFERIVGSANVRTVSVSGPVGRVTLTPLGRRHIEEAARGMGVSKRQLLDTVLGRLS